MDNITLFQQRLADIYPDHYQTLINHLNQEKKWVSFRVNTLKTDIEPIKQTLSDFSITWLDWYPIVFIAPIEQRQALLAHSAHQDGLIYCQDIASLLPVKLLDPHPGEEVLDLCAAPGSKTTQLALHMENQGRVAAVEKSKSRFFKLKSVLTTQGATIVDTYLKDGASVYRHCANRFDKVLVDAPCSSETRIQFDDTSSYSHWSEKKIQEMQRKQWPLLHSGFRSLKPGGTLIYSTCTFAPEENEFIVAKLLKKFPDQAEIVPISLPIENTAPGLTHWQGKALPQALQQGQRILPNDKMSGFFIAKIKKQF